LRDALPVFYIRLVAVPLIADSAVASRGIREIRVAAGDAEAVDGAAVARSAYEANWGRTELRNVGVLAVYSISALLE